MTTSGDTRNRAEDAFEQWLEAFRSGRAPDLSELLADYDGGVRRELERMITDFLELRERMGDGSLVLEPDRLLGDFRLMRELGRGGMAVVWEAEQVSLNRSVALKVLAPHYALSTDALSRFEREARAVGRLTHPCIVQVFAVGEDDGIHYIAQEVVDGGYTLADSLADLREQRELPTDYFEAAARHFAKIADAIEHAHSKGVIHRDLKPSNILLTEDDEPRVGDFGLAKITDELGLSRTIEIAGTPYYMSPEQAAAKSMGIDHRTDVFSLCSTLWEALTLNRAFDGDTSQHVFHKILTVNPPDPRSIRSRCPRDLAVICLKGLEKDPDRRYATMGELAAELCRFLAHEPIVARPPGRLERALKWAQRRAVAATAIAIGGASIAAIATLLVLLLWERGLKDAAVVLAEGQASIAREQESIALEQESIALEQAERARSALYSVGLSAADLAIRAERVPESRRSLDRCPVELRGWEWWHLHRRLDDSRLFLDISMQYGASVAWSPDGAKLVSVMRDGRVCVWDSETGVQLATAALPSYWPGGRHRLALAFAPDGVRVFGALFDGLRFTWHTGTGEVTTAGVRRSGREVPTDFASAAELFATASAENWVQVCAVDTGEVLFEAPSYENGVEGVELSSDGRVVASWSDGTGVKVQFTNGGEEFTLWDDAGGSVACVAFAERAERLVVVDTLGRVRVWSVEHPSVLIAESHIANWPRAAAISPDGSLIACDGGDGEITLLDGRDGSIVAELRGHPANAEVIEFGPNGKQLASLGGGLRVWDLAVGVAVEERKVTDGWSSSAVVDREGRLFTCSLSGGRVTSIDLAAGEELEAFPDRLDGDSLSMSLRGDRCFGIRRDGDFVLWNPKSATSVARWRGAFRSDSFGIFSPNGEWLASHTGGNTVNLRQTEDGEPLHELVSQQTFVSSATFSSDSSRIVMAEPFDAYSVWNVGTGELLFRHVVSDPDCGWGSQILAYDGERILATTRWGRDDAMRLWSPKLDGSSIRFEGHDNRVRCATFDPSGRRVVSGSEDATVRVWDAATGELLLVLHDGDSPVNQVSFTEDGRTLRTVSEDTTLRTWRIDP